MGTKAMTRWTEKMPSAFDEFFKPWSEYFDNGILPGRTLTMPAVNITEEKDQYIVALAAPGLKKEDFRIDVAGNMLTISSEKEENKEEKEEMYTRKEYSFSSFSRSFTLPEEIFTEKIEARYVDGVLKLYLPRKEEAKKSFTKKIAVN